MIQLVSSPIETYPHWDVKREDLCAVHEPNAPPFSKIRGVVPHLEKLYRCGIRFVGYVETSISMAGWGICWAASVVSKDLRVVLFDPQYKKTHGLLAFHRKQWAKFSNVEIVPIKAGMAKVNYYICRKKLLEKYGSKAVLLPLGLPVDESIEGTKKEAVECVNKYATVVVAVGSGTIAAGIVRAGVPRIKVVGVMCRTGNKEKKKREIINRARELGCPLAQLELVDPGYQYTEAAHIKCPFPSHPFYDKKAFKWMVENIEKLENPVLFWNIGSMNRRMTI
jgi:hypothetical protein